MSTRNDPIENMNFLTQSPVRIRILELLGEEGALSKRELVDRFDVSRVTVRRNLEALEQHDWIQNSGREYEITPLGAVVVEDLLPAIDTIELVRNLRPFLRWFPEEDLEFDVRELADAMVVVSEGANPYAPVNRHLEAMQSAARFRCLLPAVGLQPMMVVRDCVVEHGRKHTVVFDASVADTLRGDSEYIEVVDDLSECDTVEMFVVADEIGYYLGLCEACVQIGVEDDDGMPRALVETDADAVREWADETYRWYLRRAEPFDC